MTARDGIPAFTSRNHWNYANEMALNQA